LSQFPHLKPGGPRACSDPITEVLQLEYLGLILNRCVVSHICTM